MSPSIGNCIIRNDDGTFKEIPLAEFYRLPVGEGWDLVGNGGGTRCAGQEGDGYVIGGGSSNVTQDPDDFPLGKACDLSGDGTCEACQ